jgi:hypothetical protein
VSKSKSSAQRDEGLVIKRKDGVQAVPIERALVRRASDSMVLHPAVVMRRLEEAGQAMTYDRRAAGMLRMLADRLDPDDVLEFRAYAEGYRTAAAEIAGDEACFTDAKERGLYSRSQDRRVEGRWVVSSLPLGSSVVVVFGSGPATARLVGYERPLQPSGLPQVLTDRFGACHATSVYAPAVGGTSR